MLPLLELKLTATASPFKDFATGELAYAGYAVAYLMECLRECSAPLAENLDEYLSHKLLDGFTRHPVKRTVLIWFGLVYESAVLTFSAKRDDYCPTWSYEMPGYFESGRDVVTPNARPYAYWDGNNLHRLYQAQSLVLPKHDDDWGDEAQTTDPEFACDFGPLFGWTIGPVDPGIAKAMRRGDPEFWEYSIVPREAEQIVKIGEKRAVLLHSRYTIGP
jgi:hypothetical protein